MTTNKTIIRIGNDKATMAEWESRQTKLAKAKSDGKIPYCMCKSFGVPLEFFTREGKIYFRKIKNTQHSDTCEYGNHKKVVHMPVQKKTSAHTQEILRELWQEAGLNKWHPGLAGKRFWGVIQNRIMTAAGTNKTLSDLLFAPEAFNKDKADEQKTAALHKLDVIISKHGHAFLFGEIKELKKSKFDTEVIVRHAKFLRLWAKEGLIDTPEGDGVALFILAKVKKSEKGNLYIESAEQLLTSKEAFLPCHDEMEASLLDAIAKQPITFEVELAHGVTSITTKNPSLRVWIAAEGRNETVSNVSQAARPEEVVMLLEGNDPDKTIQLMLALAGQKTVNAEINEEDHGFSD